MKQVINPNECGRAEAFELWMSSPMPMVTLTKTLDVTRLRHVAHKRGCKFNMLMCWCIAQTASKMEVFYALPEQGQMVRYDKLAINLIVNNIKGGINSCDIPFDDDLSAFVRQYDLLTAKATRDCESSFIEDRIIIGTSAMIDTELDCIVNQYTDRFCNPLAMWGRYRKGWFRTRLPLSFQFHHVQMDGGHAAQFLENLQQAINNI